MGYTAIVDYGVGNLKSVSNALNFLGKRTVVTGDRRELELADAVILPGVGAFPDAADRLRAAGLDSLLVRLAQSRPVLGICLGMQLLFEFGEEVRHCGGLGLISGDVRRMETAQKLPHIGWNSLSFPNPSPLFRGVPEGAYVYFVHSFCGSASKRSQVIAVTDYGTEVVAAVQNGNVFGCQFHPEKSGETGLTILKNFTELNS